jgi:cellobiose-specific phosphotransferase system component IIC
VNDLVAREIMNGTMFVLAMLLTIAMAYRLAERVGTPRWHEEGTQAIIAVFVFMLAEDIRAGFIWVLLACQNDHGRAACTGIISSYEILFVATALAIVGKTCCIRIFSPQGWRPWSWAGAGLCAVAIPIAVHFF